ncbi:uncharacterized protein B0H64DRAFT_236182 [Chaetomium fimeti]|uniref:Mating-type switching protein swi10 n=1 Tax=Chaetomium fimeti TaxID=1854472 RepID=A0AAE0HAC5_9PEZI|nr:hypothetical protein B0H64DRAFT_236182 [Chaetomium fimeti]
MEQRKDEAPATSPKGPRLRNKLQKCVSRQSSNNRQQESPRALNPVVTLVPRALIDDDPTSLTQPRTAPSPPSRNIQPTYCTRREYDPYQRDRPLESPDLLKPETYRTPASPEFPQPIRRNPPPPPSPSSDFVPASPNMRYRTKPTSTSSVSQPKAPPGTPNTLYRTSSVELIAEQYNAVLESRYSPEHSDGSEPPLTPQASEADEPVIFRRRRSWDYHQSETSSRDSPHMAELPERSPISDDGTLVSFQGDAVYFKPLSCSPKQAPLLFSPQSEPPPPPSVPLSLSRQQTSSADDNDNDNNNDNDDDDDDDDDDSLGLQISLDLLTHDLSSAIAGRRSRRPCRPSRATSALQVWVMIEAYERMRDQMAELSQSEERARAMRDMFDLWLRALYAVHGDMSRGAREEEGSSGGAGE